MQYARFSAIALLALFACKDSEFSLTSTETGQCEVQKSNPIKVREGIAEKVVFNYHTYHIDRITSIEATGQVGIVNLDLGFTQWSNVLLYGKAEGKGSLTITAIDEDDNRKTIKLDVIVVPQSATIAAPNPSCTGEESDAGDAGTTKSDASPAADGGSDGGTD